MTKSGGLVQRLEGTIGVSETWERTLTLYIEQEWR